MTPENTEPLKVVPRRQVKGVFVTKDVGFAASFATDAQGEETLVVSILDENGDESHIYYDREGWLGFYDCVTAAFFVRNIVATPVGSADEGL